MSWLHQLEDFLCTKLEGWFRKKFPDPVGPVDLAKSLWKQMRKQRFRSIKKVYVPNYYLIRLHPDDLEQLVSIQKALTKELAEYLEQKAAERRLSLVGPVQVHLDWDRELSPGQVTVVGRMQEKHGREEKKEHDLGQTLVYQGPLSREDGMVFRQWQLEVVAGPDVGKVYQLQAGCNVIGRQPGIEISLTDPRVSRQHAWVEVMGEQILVTDLDSTNGTLVNEERIQTKLVGSGARLEVGDTVLLLKEVVN
ncbi:MAG: DUF3662 domain-containing protein [Clostridia bacterium]|nr:DUF3662 domain-containing protein [Clostridia bacterium]